jgi:hypothetical protein
VTIPSAQPSGPQERRDALTENSKTLRRGGPRGCAEHRPTGTAAGGRRVDFIGALLCVLSLGGSVFALIEQPRLGWSNPAVASSLIGGVILFAAFLFYESRASDPMLRLDLFKSRNFAVGNVETLTLYGGLSAFFFFLVLYLQQVAGYSPLKSGWRCRPRAS